MNLVTIEGDNTSWTRERIGTGDAISTRTTDGTVYTVDYDIYIFGINHADNPIGSGSRDSKVNLVSGVKLSAIELYEDHTLMMDLQPARRSDGRTGYYDTLNDDFYFSENAYDFNVGNYADEYIYYDYLESDLQQYILTGIIPDNTTRVKGKMQMVGENRFFAFGARDSNGVNQFLIRLSNGSGRTSWNYGNQQIDSDPVTVGETYTVDANRNIWTRTDSENFAVVNIFNVQTFTTMRQLALFALFGENNILYRDNGRLGDLQIYKSDVLMRNFRPSVRRWDGKAGMFEQVNNILYQSYSNKPFSLYGNWT